MERCSKRIWRPAIAGAAGAGSCLCGGADSPTPGLSSLGDLVPQWYKPFHHVAYWDKYARPTIQPRYARGRQAEDQLTRGR